MLSFLQEYGALAAVILSFSAGLLLIIYWPRIQFWAENKRREWE